MPAPSRDFVPPFIQDADGPVASLENACQACGQQPRRRAWYTSTSSFTDLCDGNWADVEERLARVLGPRAVGHARRCSDTLRSASATDYPFQIVADSGLNRPSAPVSVSASASASDPTAVTISWSDGVQPTGESVVGYYLYAKKSLCCNDIAFSGPMPFTTVGPSTREYDVKGLLRVGGGGGVSFWCGGV